MGNKKGGYGTFQCDKKKKTIQKNDYITNAPQMAESGVPREGPKETLQGDRGRKRFSGEKRKESPADAHIKKKKKKRDGVNEDAP